MIVSSTRLCSRSGVPSYCLCAQVSRSFVCVVIQHCFADVECLFVTVSSLRPCWCLDGLNSVGSVLLLVNWTCLWQASSSCSLWQRSPEHYHEQNCYRLSRQYFHFMDFANFEWPFSTVGFTGAYFGDRSDWIYQIGPYKQISKSWYVNLNFYY